jgi:hypothetical protein
MKRFLLLFCALAFVLPLARGDDRTPAPPGLRILTAGHSFHFWMPKILEGVAASAGIRGHQTVDVQYIGGSQVYAHWKVPDDKNKIKPVLIAGGADVLTLSPIYLPDSGIEDFAKLGLEHNPNLRITVQEFWLPYDDQALWATRAKDAVIDPNKKTIEELRAAHAPYFESMDAEIRRVNAEVGKQAVFVVPVGQAVLALREKIIKGEVPGMTEQRQLFTDPLGHPHEQIKVLATYCHFAVIYKRSPVGLPVPEPIAKAPEAEKLNALLEQIAWDAVIHHPLSGVTAAVAK